MTTPSADLFRVTLAETIALHQQMMGADPTPLLDAAAAITVAFRSGGKLLFFGNGGSAADAQHAAGELVGRFLRERAGFPAIALSTDTSILTSIGNDYSFDRVFSRQVEALGRPGDIAFGITTSGGSPNVVCALQQAKRQRLQTIALTGRDGGIAGETADFHINVPSSSTPRIQEVHMTFLHVICDLVERALA